MARIIFTLEDGTEIEAELDSDMVTIGRHPDSTVVLPSASVSGQHATIKRRGEGFFVQDLGTTNGTKLNGVEVEEARLEHGDRLSFGDVPAVVQLVDKPAKSEAPSKNVSYPLPSTKSTGSVPTVAPAGAGAGASPRRMPPRRNYRPSSDYNEGSGCAGFIGMLIFLALAFLAGLCIRHAKDHNGSFLPMDLFKKYSEKGDSGEAPVKTAPGAPKSAPAATPDKPAAPAPAKPAAGDATENKENK